MIPAETLRRITPVAPETLRQFADPRELGAAADDPVLRDLALWNGAFRAVARREVLDGPLGVLAERALLIGTGVVDWPVPADGAFPAEGGYRLGIAVYLPMTASGEYGAGYETVSARSLDLQQIEIPEVPLALLPAALTPAAHPGGGRSAAMAEDAAGVRMLLTAGHVVAKKRLGARVTLGCATCPGGCHATVEAKGSGYIDAAILRIGQANCRAMVPPVGGGVSVPLTGLRVRQHFGSTTGWVASTVMQGLAPPVMLINPVAPRTFLTSVIGQAGDSGSAVSDDPVGAAIPALAGVHSGYTDILVAPGRIVQRSYAQDADEALRLFNCTLLEGLYR